MSNLILNAKLVNVLGAEETYVYSRIVAWVTLNEKKKLSYNCIDGRYYTRLSFKTLASKGLWKLKDRTVKYVIKKLLDENFIESVADAKSYHCGRLYTYTDKIHSIITDDEFEIIANTYNADVNSKDDQEDYSTNDDIFDISQQLAENKIIRL